MPPNPSSPTSHRRRRHTSSGLSSVLSQAFNPITRPHHHRSTATAPVTDVQSSGGNYGLKKARKYKRTKQYHRIVRDVKRSQHHGHHRKPVSKGGRNPFAMPGSRFKAFNRARHRALERVHRADDLAKLQNVLHKFPLVAKHQRTSGYYAAIAHVNGPAASELMNRYGTHGPRRLSAQLSHSDRVQLHLLEEARRHLLVPVLKGIHKQHKKQAKQFHKRGVAAPWERTVKEGKPDKTIPFPTGDINLSGIERGISSHIGAIGPYFANADPVLKHAFADIKGLPKGMVVGPYELGAAAWEASHGDTKRLVKIYKGLKSGPTGQLLEHPLHPKYAVRALGKHPVLGALEVAGDVGAVGRVGGAVARAAPKGSRLYEYASTERPPLHTAERAQAGHRAASPSRAGTVERHGSPNLIVRRFQARSDRKHGGQASTRGGHLSQRSRTRKQAVDRYVHYAHSNYSAARHHAAKEAVDFLPRRPGDSKLKGAIHERAHVLLRRPEAQVVHLAIERRLRSPRTFAADLRRIKARLDRVHEAESHRMKPDVRRSNRSQARAIQRVLDDPKALANAKGVFEAALRYAKHQDPVEKALIAHHALDEGQAWTQRLRPYAIEHMGASYSHRKALTDRGEQEVADLERKLEQHRAASTEAAKGLVNARKRLDTAHRRYEEASRKAGVGQGRAEVLSRGIGGRRAEQSAERAGNPRARSEGQYAAGGHGAREAHAEYESAGQRVVQAEEEVRRAEKAYADAEREKGAVQGDLSRRRGVKFTEGLVVEADNPEHAKLMDRAEKVAEHVRRGYQKAGNEGEVAAARRRLEELNRRIDRTPRTLRVHLTNKMIAAHMKENGVVGLPSFVSHSPLRRGSKSWFQPFLPSRPAVDFATGIRTGEATRLGAHGHDLQTLLEHHVRSTGQVQRLGHFDGFIREFGRVRPGGEPFTWARAQEAIEHYREQGHEFVAVRNVPARYTSEQRAAILEGQGPEELHALQGPMEQRLKEALAPPASETERQARNVVLVPAEQWERFRSHELAVSSTQAKAAQAVTNVFRNTVLPFSTKWVFGNAGEAALRLAIRGAGVHTGSVGIRYVRALGRVDKEAAEQFKAAYFGGRTFGMNQRLKTYTGPDRFKGTALHGPAVAANAVRVPVRIGAGATLGFSLAGPEGAALGALVGASIPALRGLSFGINGLLEKAADYAALGKVVKRDLQEFSGSYAKAIIAQRSALEELARALAPGGGKINMAKFNAYIGAKHEILGKYDSFSPQVRRMIQTATPFAPWYVNSLRFILTFPVKHPVKHAIIQRVASTFQRDWEEQHKALGALASGDLGYALPTKDGGWLNVARYTPAGVYTEGVASIPDVFYPQAAAPFLNLIGISWKGKPFQLPKGTKDSDLLRVAIAFNSVGEGMVPLVSVFRRLREGGSTAYDNSFATSPKVKPNTKHISAVRRVFDPFAPVYVKPDSAGSGEGGFDFSTAGHGDRGGWSASPPSKNARSKGGWSASPPAPAGGSQGGGFDFSTAH